MYDGNKIGKDDTPKTHDMEDNDTIEVHIEQVCLFLSRSLSRTDNLSTGRWLAAAMRVPDA